jgi:hypothetical protein
MVYLIRLAKIAKRKKFPKKPAAREVAFRAVHL